MRCVAASVRVHLPASEWVAVVAVVLGTVKVVVVMVVVVMVVVLRLCWSRRWARLPSLSPLLRALSFDVAALVAAAARPTVWVNLQMSWPAGGVGTHAPRTSTAPQCTPLKSSGCGGSAPYLGTRRNAHAHAPQHTVHYTT